MTRDAMNTNVSGEQLSAMVDGELDTAAAVQACVAWRNDAEVREIWHTYHLIGDVLRSEDLAAPAARDAALLRAVRQRLGAEPVVLAPSAAPASSAQPARVLARHMRRWRGPAAVAAGFVAVAGVLVVTRESTVAVPPVATVASVSASAPEGMAADPSEASVGDVPVTDGRLIRDARLDRYLAAHKQFAGNALGVPAAYLRSVTADVPADR